MTVATTGLMTLVIHIRIEYNRDRSHSGLDNVPPAEFVNHVGTIEKNHESSIEVGRENRAGSVFSDKVGYWGELEGIFAQVIVI